MLKTIISNQYNNFVTMRKALLFFLLLTICDKSNSNLFCDISEIVNSPEISPQCMNQLKKTCNNADLSYLFYDASSRFLTSGMSYSNVVDYGNFPECLSIDYNKEGEKILGKYCGFSLFILNLPLIEPNLAMLNRLNISVSKPSQPQKISMSQYQQLDIETRDLMIKDVPFSISKYAMCIPEACRPSEVGHFFFQDRLQIPYENESISLFIYPEIIDCETKDSNTELTGGDIAYIIFISVILLLMLSSTAYDAYIQRKEIKPAHKLLLMFSILYNGKKLLKTTKNNPEQIRVFNGMRFISIAWVMAFHGITVFESGVVGIPNFKDVKEWESHWTNRYINNALLAVDTFFYISGFLLAFSYFKKSTKKSLLDQIYDVPKGYLHRYIRLTPALAAMYFTTVTIFHMLGKGPIYTFLNRVIRNPCIKYWWQFFLYIQNYTNSDNMCVVSTWYLSVDMQLFILAPIVLIPAAIFVKTHFKYVLNGLIGLAVFWVLCPMFIRLYDTKEPGNIYTTHERINVFLIGIIFGLVMRNFMHKPFLFTKTQNLLIWIIVLVVSLAFNIYWHDVTINYSLIKYTFFYGLHRPLWCLCLSFMVYSCYYGYGGVIGWFLSTEMFEVLGKLSYSMYILHYIIELYAFSLNMTPVTFSNYIMFYYFSGHFIVTLTFSVFWVLAFEYPMMMVDEYIIKLLSFNRTKSKI